jgi:hypothetical protein
MMDIENGLGTSISTSITNAGSSSPSARRKSKHVGSSSSPSSSSSSPVKRHVDGPSSVVDEQTAGDVEDAKLRVLFFTATYFVLDGVTLTIRRIESHLRGKGAAVKVLTTVPDDATTEQLDDVIAVPGIKIPFDHAGSYAFGTGLDAGTISQIEDFNPTVVHFTVPDFVALDGIRWCQAHNVAYIATWHSNYCDYLKVNAALLLRLWCFSEDHFDICVSYLFPVLLHRVDFGPRDAPVLERLLRADPGGVRADPAHAEQDGDVGVRVVRATV